MLEKQAQTHETLFELVDSVMDATLCVTEVQRFKTSDQLIDRLQELQPLVNSASEFVHMYLAKSSKTGRIFYFVPVEMRWH
jgi:hypothetical protein